MARSDQDLNRAGARGTESVGDFINTRLLSAGGMVILFILIFGVGSYVKETLMKGSDSTGFYTAAAAVLVIAALFSMRPKWRQSASSGIGSVLAVLAWLTALFADFTNDHNVGTTFAMMMSTCFLGIAYVVFFRPLGTREREKEAAIKRADQEKRLRQVIREEMQRIYKERG